MFFLDNAKDAEDFVAARNDRPLRTRNYFGTKKSDFEDWKEKGIVETIDIEDSDKENMKVDCIFFV